jgi:hypothetical protein
MANTCLHIDSKDRFSVLRGSAPINTPTLVPGTQLLSDLRPSNPGSGGSIVSTDLEGLVLGYSIDPITNAINPQPLVNSFTIQAAQPLVYGYMRNIKIASVNFHYGIPTIVPSVQNGRQTPNGNDKFEIENQTNGQSEAFTIPFGYYSPVELAAMIQTLVRLNINLDMPDFTATYNTRNGFEFRSNNGNLFSFYLQSQNFQPIELVNGYYDAILKTARTLGLTILNSPAYADTIQLGTRGTMLYTDYVDICSTALTKYQNQRDTNSDPKKLNNIVCRFYLNGTDPTFILPDSALGSAPFSIYQHYNTTKTMRWSREEAVYEIDIQLRDMWGELLFDNPEVFGSATEFQMTLLCFEDK